MSRKRTTLDNILPKSSTASANGIVNPRQKVQGQQGEPEKVVNKRPDVKQPALYLKIPVHRQLRILAFEEDKKMHDLFLEAIDMLLADRGVPSISELTSSDTTSEMNRR